MQARDIIARAIAIHDHDNVPDGFADKGFADDAHISDWSAYLAVRAILELNNAGYVVVPLSAVPPSYKCSPNQQEDFNRRSTFKERA
jgi:hypothetical protein